MTGWIIYNGNFQSDKIYELVLWLKKTGERKGIHMIPIKNNDILMYYDQKGKAVLTLDRPDFVISWDKDIPLVKYLELLNIPVYNSSEGIHICDHKIKMTEALASHDIPMPQTIIAPMVFSNCQIIDFKIYDSIIEKLGLPMIIKEAYGSFGMQVYKVDSKESLIEKVKEIGNKEHLFQSYIKESHGRDIRINLVNHQVVASMKRVSEVDFRANITNGGKGYAYQASDQEKALAVKCSQILDLDFCGVDLLFGENGPILCEVNGNPHFKSVYEATGIDVSEFMLDYIIEDLKC